MKILVFVIIFLVLIGSFVICSNFYNISEMKEEKGSRVSLGITEIYDYKNGIILYYTPQGEFLTYNEIE